MEKLLKEVEEYARLANVPPERVLRNAIGASWNQWTRWKAGKASPTMRVVDRLRAYMDRNPPSGQGVEASQEAAE